MTRILYHLSVAVLSLASACAELTLETLRKRQEQMRTTIRTAMPSVVGIEFPNAGDGSGSGVIVSADGLILTAAHVSGESNRDITVIMLGGERLPGKTLGAYRSLDAGMIQVEVNNRSFPHVPLGDATALEQGQWCLAIGHPGGFVKDRTPPVRLGRLLSLEENGFLLTDSTLVGGGFRRTFARPPGPPDRHPLFHRHQPIREPTCPHQCFQRSMEAHAARQSCRPTL